MCFSSDTELGRLANLRSKDGARCTEFLAALPWPPRQAAAALYSPGVVGGSVPGSHEGGALCSAGNLYRRWRFHSAQNWQHHLFRPGAVPSMLDGDDFAE